MVNWSISPRGLGKKKAHRPSTLIYRHVTNPQRPLEPLTGWEMRTSLLWKKQTSQVWVTLLKHWIIRRGQIRVRKRVYVSLPRLTLIPHLEIAAARPKKRKLIDRAASGLWTVNINPNINPELTYVITDGVIYITTSYRKVSRENPKTWTSKRPDVLGFLDFPGPPTVTWRFDLLVQWQPEGCKQVLEQLKSNLNA